MINLYRKGKCPLHQTQLEKHRLADCCDKSQGVKAYMKCSQFRELQQAVKNCGDCGNTWLGGEDQIVKTALIDKNDEVQVIFKKEVKNFEANQNKEVKNYKISVYGKKRVSHCPLHQTQLEKHRLADCCDKSQGVKAYMKCSQFRELQQAVKNCGDCGNPQFFRQNLRRQINCEQIVDLLVSKTKENLICLLLRDDNTSQIFDHEKIPYCRTHWAELEKIQTEKEEVSDRLKKKRDELVSSILDSGLPIEEKKMLFERAKIELSGELTKKLATSLVEKILADTNNNEVRESVIRRREEKISDYNLVNGEKAAVEKKERKAKSNWKDTCNNCKKYCPEHSKQLGEHKSKKK
ncbi:373_t:CDS:2, partial [Racocetra persica]